MTRSKQQPPIPDLRGNWENYALTHGLPMRCETNVVWHDGSCMVCSAENGEACRRAKPPTTPYPVDRILALSDEEILASATPEELAWVRGVKAGIKLGQLIALPTPPPS